MKKAEQRYANQIPRQQSFKEKLLPRVGFKPKAETLPTTEAAQLAEFKCPIQVNKVRQGKCLNLINMYTRCQVLF